MATVNNCLLRLTDIRTMAWYVAGALRNYTGGVWEKFEFDGKGSNDGTYQITKTKDFELGNGAELRFLFDRTAQGTKYEKAMKNATASIDVSQAKRQSDMLSSMLQAMGQRYGTRLRHTAAAAARRLSIASIDADAISQDVSI